MTDVIADREVTVSYSELQAYRKCPLMWSWGYKARWRRPNEPGSNLDKGTAFHAAAEVHYTILKENPEGSAADRLNLAAQAVEDVALSNMTPEMAELIAGMYERYVAQYGTDPQWQILGVEEQGKFLLGHIQVPVYHGESAGLVIPNGTETVAVYIKWKADLIVFDTTLRGNLVIDHKTASALQKAKSLQWDDQLPIYDMGYRLAHPGVKILGGMHNEARKPKAGTNPANSKTAWNRRTRGTYTLKGMKEIADNALNTVRAMLTDRDLFSNPGIKATDCGFCDFEDVHTMTRAGVPAEATLKAQGFEQKWERH